MKLSALLYQIIQKFPYNMVSLKVNNIVTGKIDISKKISVVFDESAKILIEDGCFYFNKKWVAGDPFPSLLCLRKNSTIIVKDTFKIYSGSRVYVNENAKLILGGGYINHNLNLSCFESIEIGSGVAISENVTIRDSDNHAISPFDRPITKPVKIGDNVWIGMNATVLKGVSIGDGAVVAACSLVNQDVPENSMVAGVPACVVKENIKWR